MNSLRRVFTKAMEAGESISLKVISETPRSMRVNHRQALTLNSAQIFLTNLQRPL
jgi:hypothetical protein